MYSMLQMYEIFHIINPAAPAARMFSEWVKTRGDNDEKPSAYDHESIEDFEFQRIFNMATESWPDEVCNEYISRLGVWQKSAIRSIETMEIVQSAYNAINAFPWFKSIDDSGYREYINLLKRWQTADEVRHFLTMYDDYKNRKEIPKTVENIFQLILILRGDETTLIKVSKTWYHYANCKILYQSPDMTIDSVKSVLIVRAIDEFYRHPSFQQKTQDKVIEFKNNLAKNMFILVTQNPRGWTQLHELSGTKFTRPEQYWFNFHVADLLFKVEAYSQKPCSKTSSSSSPFKSELEGYAFQFCTQVLLKSNFSSLAMMEKVATYLDLSCPVSGRQLLISAISRYPALSEKDVYRVKELAKKFRLLDDSIAPISSSSDYFSLTPVYRQIIHRFRIQGRYCSALHWCNEGNDTVMLPSLSSLLVDLFYTPLKSSPSSVDATTSQSQLVALQEIVEKLKETSPSSLMETEDDPNDLLIYDRVLGRNILYLIQYYQMRKNYNDKNYKGSAMALIKCIVDGLVPFSHIVNILSDAMHLMKDHNVYLGTHELYFLLQTVELFQSSLSVESAENAPIIEKIPQYFFQELHHIINENLAHSLIHHY
eukprot:TRINITY_DN7749_c0_g1_i2.p1 TRINITY_DN7749_c0_g1~~TRINITY_DN7749_c0_g1_i2.p1  ORF type:complete len:596 (+),score=147.41 TRINITY_DN7749_c0_g1_i2:311-2098(+)